MPSPALRARRIVDAAERFECPGDEPGALALAWALKDHGYAAWNRDPSAAVRAAEALAQLRAAAPPAWDGATRAELAAVSDWMAGIGALTQGRMTDALSAFDAASAAFADLGQRGRVAHTQVPKIMALSVLGRHQEAADCGEAALVELKAIADIAAASRVSLNLGHIHRRRNDFARACACFRQAGVMSARLGDRERSVMADIGLGDALASLGDFDESLRMFARAGMRAGQHGFPVLVALVEESVALVDLARGRWRSAFAGLEGSRRKYEQLAMPQHLAIAEKQLADAYLEVRLLPEALRLFEQAIARFDTLEMPVEKAWAMVQRGRALTLLGGLGDGDTARQLLEESSRLFKAQGVPAGLATVALAQAELALERGEAALASAAAATASQIFADAGLAEGRARSDAVRAHALAIGGDRSQAADLAGGTLATATLAGLLPVQVRCAFVQGIVHQAEDRPAEARAAFESAIALFEDQRDALPGDDLRSAFLVEHMQAYGELLRMTLQAAARSPSPALDAEVLACLERVRARALGERLGRPASAPTAPGADPLVDNLRSRISWLHRQLRHLNESGDAGGSLVDEIRRNEVELLERVRRERLTGAADTWTATTGRAFDAAPVCRALAAGDGLVEYGVQDDELFACIVTRDGVALRRRLAGWEDVVEAIGAARFQIEALRHGAGQLSRHLPLLTQRAVERLKRLHDLIWAPLGLRPEALRRVIVVPHERLGRVPFAALHDGEAFLSDRFEWASAPSARVALHGLLRQVAPPQRVVALGESLSLPQAGSEARFVASLFAQADVLTDGEARVDRLRALAPGADVLHLACHAQFRADNLMFSALQLADGLLTVETTEQLALKAGIVTLSGCETGLADEGPGDEAIGLVRGFLIAGAGRVVASLWPVDDAITRRFMALFYGALHAGKAPSEALSGAQQDLRRDQPHPFHWAPFVLHGGF